MCDKFGLNNCVAQLFTVLYLSKFPLSLDDLAQRLNISKGNVSVNVRELERWGAAKKIWIKGSRKDFYEAEVDLKKIFVKKLKSGLQKHISEISEMCEEFNDKIYSADGELNEEEQAIVLGYKERIKKIEELNGFILSMFTMAENFYNQEIIMKKVI